MSVPLHHGLRLPATKPLEFVRRRTCLAMPGSERMPQIVRSKVLDPCASKRIPPRLRVYLTDRVPLVRENVRWMVALARHKDLHGHLIQRNRVRSAVLVLVCRTQRCRRSKLICFHSRHVTFVCRRPVATENCAMSRDARDAPSAAARAPAPPGRASCRPSAPGRSTPNRSRHAARIVRTRAMYRFADGGAGVGFIARAPL
jgi:hypothetical protein